MIFMKFWDAKHEGFIVIRMKTAADILTAAQLITTWDIPVVWQLGTFVGATMIAALPGYAVTQPLNQGVS